MALTLMALTMLLPLIVVFEVIAFQLMRWGPLRACVKTAVQVNAITFVIGLALTFLVPKPNLWQLLIYLAFAIVTEALLLTRIKPGSTRLSWSVSILANAISYIVLILPAFRFQ